MKISARFRPIFYFELKEKRSRAEPSWKSFSSSSGSSQLGSDSSLVGIECSKAKEQPRAYCPNVLWDRGTLEYIWPGGVLPYFCVLGAGVS